MTTGTTGSISSESTGNNIGQAKTAQKSSIVGMVVGITIGGLLLVVLVVVTASLLKRKRKKEQSQRRSEGPPTDVPMENIPREDDNQKNLEQNNSSGTYVMLPTLPRTPSTYGSMQLQDVQARHKGNSVLLN